MKEAPKYLKETKKKKSRWPLVLLLVVVIAAAVCAVFFLNVPVSERNDPEGTSGTQAKETTETAASEQTAPAEVPTEPESYSEIQTAYLPVQLPQQYQENLEHQEVVEGETAMEIFTMKTESGETELFRIYFGDDQSGNPVGTLTVDGEKIPVTVSVCEYGDDYFADQETRNLYYDMMDSLNAVIGSIQNDGRFSSGERVNVEKADNQLSYWTFSLPEGMEWEETTGGDMYRVTFYGKVNGETYVLYALALGDETLKNILGTYQADGVTETVSIESYELPDTEGWSESSVMELYKMMESINDVIQVVMESEGFSEVTQ